MTELEDYARIVEEETEQANRLAEVLHRAFEFDIESVLDVGCGPGIYLEPFYKEGIKVRGLDLHLEEALAAREDSPLNVWDLMSIDFLEVPLTKYDRYSFTLCLEVLEHVPEEKSLDFVEHLCKTSDVIVFSAAFPGQGGVGHVNCQPKKYWENLFFLNGFSVDKGTTEYIVNQMHGGYHMGWLVNNLMVFRKFNAEPSPAFTLEKKHSNKDEVMNVDPETGGMKASKPSQLGFIDPQALLVLGEVAGMGAEKYDKFNYLKGFDWSLCYNAMMRHAQAAWDGQDLDPESGLPHFAHAAWQALALLSFYQRDIGTDDRPGTVMGWDKR